MNFKRPALRTISTSPYYTYPLKNLSAQKLWTPEEIYITDKTCLSCAQFMQWKLWFTEEVKAKLNNIGPSGRNIVGVQLMYEMLNGEGKMGQSKKTNYPTTCHLIYSS